jgi:aminoglycoside/choline kinase family phosphotransferase
LKELQRDMEELMEKILVGDEEVTNWVKKARTIESVERLPGDASTRRYYRVNTPGRPLILMKRDPFEKEAGKLPFLEVQKHLFDCGVSVPEVLEYDPKNGFILLEDLGDVTLLRRLQEVGDTEVERHLYERVIDVLVDLQVKSGPKAAAAKIAGFDLSFTFEKLMWEVNFAIEHFYEVHLSREIRPRDKEILQNGFSRICAELSALPTVFTHRDFHSRNIMLKPTDSSQEAGSIRLILIDFQDARMGPPQYDLASVLRDSYYQLSENQVDRLLDYYVARYEALSDEEIDRERFRYLFDLMAIQRNFKAIGSFASFLNRRGNATYLKYIGNTFENIRRTLLRYPDFKDLREVLFHYYYF